MTMNVIHGPRDVARRGGSDGGETPSHRGAGVVAGVANIVARDASNAALRPSPGSKPHWIHAPVGGRIAPHCLQVRDASAIDGACRTLNPISSAASSSSGDGNG